MGLTDELRSEECAGAVGHLVADETDVAALPGEDAVAQATPVTLSMLAERVEQLTRQIDELNGA